MKRLLIFLFTASLVFAMPESGNGILNTYYPDHSASGGNAIYLSLIYTTLGDRHYGAAIVGYEYIKGIGSARERGKDCIIMYKYKNRTYVQDNRTMHPVEVPYSDVVAAIEFYWREALGEDFIQVKYLGHRTNEYWYK